MPTGADNRSSAQSAQPDLLRFGSQFLLDAAAWGIALTGALLLRYEFEWAHIDWVWLAGLVVATAVSQLAIGWLYYLYRGRYTYGTFEEVRALTVVVVAVGLLLAIPVLVLGGSVGLPRSIGFIAIPIALVLVFSVRYLKRLYVDSRHGPGDQAVPTLIFGAGFVGSQLTRRLHTDRLSLFRAVGLVDDDPAKRHLQIAQVRVLGALEQLPALVAETGARVLVVAIANPDAELLRRVHDAAQELDLQVKVPPPLLELLERGARPVDLRDLRIEDLLGRQPLDTNVESVGGYLTGRRVLVTGAGGSIGSELCAQIARFAPEELIMLDRDETGLQQAQLTIAGHGLLHTKDVVLADIRDEGALFDIFAERRPEVVFHAAALKHLPMLEQYPDEAWKTNVLGTLNVLRAAQSVGVHTVINISTDKAANPTSVLGHSKRVAEKLTSWFGEQTGDRYLSVRFGNVIGSRGSMLPTFTRLIEQGGPLTVTHPEVTRYFMTIPEACQLVLQAGGIGRVGEVLILDMGEPVRILDIAERMIELSGKDIEIVFTGLREGEKLHEELVGDRETVDRPLHPKISHAYVDSLTPSLLDREDWLTRVHEHPRNNDTRSLARLREGIPS